MDQRPALPDPRAAHVWFVELTASGAALEACASSLSVDESARAARFAYAHLRSAFTLSRGVLRILLGRYLGIAPGRVRFAYGMRGKPRVEFPATRLEFNLAHSGRYAAYAFAAGCALGIDIEEHRRLRDGSRIVRRFFSPAECAEWSSLEAAERDAAFYRCWTRKEAYIKALGEGLSIPLNRFRVSLQRDASAALLHDEADPAAAERWAMVALAPADGYTGALALGERGRDVRVMPALTAAEVLELAVEGRPFPPEPAGAGSAGAGR
jgi:4'-phosphopantetheinyl transferase